MKTMEVEINNQKFNVLINRKMGNKNMYLRVKDEDTLYITCNTLITEKMIIAFIQNNVKSIEKMLHRVKKKEERANDFYYLGKKYDVVYLNTTSIMFSEERVYVNANFDLEKWYKKEATRVFQEELDKVYQNFKYRIPYPSLTIRKMKTRWGVCNVKTHRVTLNLELIKRRYEEIDYVIVHELSHLLHANHSKSFWQCVEDNFPNYKKVRKELKNNE